MKALIFSDSHNTIYNMYEAIEANPDTNLIIFAGDIQRDIETVSASYPQLPCVEVLGNNDFFVHDVPFDRTFIFGGKKIFLTHGHKYYVKSYKQPLIAEAKRNGADICIFGHTHTKYLEHGDIWVVNPGSMLSTYAILTIVNGEISIIHKDI